MTGFGRSNSLSINTGTGALFGNAASQGQQSAGLFGSSTASSQPQTAGGLFGSTTQPQTGGSLFGGGAAASQPPQSGGGLFGQQASSQPQSGGGLFSSVNKPAGQAGTGLFGSSTAQSGSVFGGALGQQNQQNQNQNTSSQSGGLFTLGQAPKPSLFGSSTQQTAQTPSLFGASTTQQQQQPQQQQQASTPSLFGGGGPSLFSGMASQNKPFGGLSLGGHTVSGPSQSTAQPSLQIIDPNLIKGTTRFQDLGPQWQTDIVRVDEEIQAWIKTAMENREKLPKHGEKVAQVAPDVAYIDTFLSTVELGIDNDSNNIALLKEVCKRDNDDALLCFRAIENLKLPSQFHYANMSTLPGKPRVPTAPDANSNDPAKPVDLVAYFSKRADELGQTLESYQKQIREIEAHLRTMEEGTQVMAQKLMGSRDELRDQKRQLIDALKAIEGAIFNAATKVTETREVVVKQTIGGVGRGLGLGV